MKPTSFTRFLLSASALAVASTQAQQKPAGPIAGPTGPSPLVQPAVTNSADDAADAAAFKTPEERRNYALGVFMANQLKRADDGVTKVNLDDVEAGLNSVLKGEKSADFVNGASLGNMLKRDELKVDAAQLMVALREIMGGGKSKLSESGLRNEMQLVQQEALARRQEKTKIEGEANLKEATAFLEKNSKAEGISITPSGLQFKVLTPAKGAKPKPGELVNVNFVGTLANGKEFDRSQPGQPRTLPQNMTAGWQEAMAMMEVGSKYQFWMSPTLAFGEAGRPPLIRPNSAVIYEVELVGTQPAPAAETAPNQSMTTPPLGMPGAKRPPNRQPISATTPPVSIEIPQKPATPKDAPKETPKDAPKAPAPTKESK